MILLIFWSWFVHPSLFTHVFCVLLFSASCCTFFCNFSLVCQKGSDLPYLPVNMACNIEEVVFFVLTWTGCIRISINCRSFKIHFSLYRFLWKCSSSCLCSAGQGCVSVNVNEALYVILGNWVDVLDSGLSIKDMLLPVTVYLSKHTHFLLRDNDHLSSNDA